eukprot:1545061-Rhodomonas_salina.1
MLNASIQAGNLVRYFMASDAERKVAAPLMRKLADNIVAMLVFLQRLAEGLPPPGVYGAACIKCAVERCRSMTCIQEYDDTHTAVPSTHTMCSARGTNNVHTADATAVEQKEYQPPPVLTEFKYSLGIIHRMEGGNRLEDDSYDAHAVTRLLVLCLECMSAAERWVRPHMVLRASYAITAIVLRVAYAVSGTGLCYAATRRPTRTIGNIRYQHWL